MWATDALDVVRRDTWNTARKVGLARKAKQLKGCRYALWKNPEHLTGRQAGKLAWIAKHNNRLYRAYLLKEQFRLVFQHRGARRSPCSTPGSPGLDAAASPPSSTSPVAS